MKRILDGKGGCTDVRPGLVDKSGAFLLLLDANETRHYRFSGEAECIAELLDEIADHKAANERLHETLDKMAEALQRKDEKLARAYARLEEFGTDAE